MRRGLTVAKSAAFRVRRRVTRPPHTIGSDEIAAHWYTGMPNFGDALCPLILHAMTGRRVALVPSRLPRKVLSIGSVLGHAAPGDLIVGSGLIEGSRFRLPRGVEILGLRGPLSARLVGASDIGLGDPGLVAAEMLGISRARSAEHSIGLIPHYSHLEAVEHATRQSARSGASLHVVDVRLPPLRVLEAIAKCSVCVSTSLHGIIAAESLGIPAVWATAEPVLRGQSFKFHDYYLSTDRDPPTPLPVLKALHLAATETIVAFEPDLRSLRRWLGEAAERLR